MSDALRDEIDDLREQIANERLLQDQQRAAAESEFRNSSLERERDRLKAELDALRGAAPVSPVPNGPEVVPPEEATVQEIVVADHVDDDEDDTDPSHH